jgi:molybdate transport system substrate-binding protein
MRIRRRPVCKRFVLGLVLLLLTPPQSPGVPIISAQESPWACPAPGSTSIPASEATPADEAIAPVDFPPGGRNLTVFAAASLTDAFEAMGEELKAEYPTLSIAYNFGGSQALVTQLREGAQADVFASANAVQMQAAHDAGLITGEPAIFAGNVLVVVTPNGNPADIQDAADLREDGVRLVLAQPEVPAGGYARDVICRMAADPSTYGHDFVERVAANVVSEEEDVRDVLAKVALGEADAGIVYVSDAVAAGDQVHVVDIPDEVNVIATYPVAVLVGGDEALGSAFVAYLLSEEGQALLESYGFQPVK